MIKFFEHRWNRRGFYLGGGLLILLSLLQVYLTKAQMNPNNMYQDSPYTMWMNVNPNTSISIIYYLLLPLLCVLPTGVLLKEDLQTNLFSKVKLYFGIPKSLVNYSLVSFIGGMITACIPLILNVLIWFTLVPNIYPHPFRNDNIRILTDRSLFCSLFYEHPLQYITSYILLVAFWGGIFSLFVTAVSLWIKNKFLATAMAFITQLILYLIDSLFPMLVGGNLSAMEFLFVPTTPGWNVITTAIGYILLSMILIYIGGKRIVE